ncbi:glutamate racemase, partial [Streptomyces sp. NPDC007162]
HGSAGAVAAQALRRIGAQPAAPGLPATGTVTVLLNGREGELPEAALSYAEGRLLRAVTAADPAVSR